MTMTTTDERVIVQRQVDLPATFPEQIADALAELAEFEAKALALAERVGRTITLEYKVAAGMSDDDTRTAWEQRVGWDNFTDHFTKVGEALVEAADMAYDTTNSFDWASDVEHEACLRIVEGHDGNLDQVPGHVLRDLVRNELARRDMNLSERFAILDDEEASRALVMELIAERRNA